MPKHLDVEPSAFRCSICAEDNGAIEHDDPQTYKAYLTWMKTHRTNYVTSPTGLCICANRHHCTQETYDSLREQAIRKRGLGTYAIACPVAGCAEALYETPLSQPLWNCLVTVCKHTHLVDFNCYLRLLSENITKCPLCRETLQLDATKTIPTVAASFPEQICAPYRPLDGLDNFLNMLLSADEVSGANLRHTDYKNIIHNIFFDARYPLPWQREASRRGSDSSIVSRFLLLSTDEDTLSEHKKALEEFSEVWKEFVKVLDREAPCTKVVCYEFILELKTIISPVSRWDQPAYNEVLRKSVVADLRVAIDYLTDASLFIERTWWSIENAQTGLVLGDIPSEPQLPDVAAPQPSAEDTMPQYLR